MRWTGKCAQKIAEMWKGFGPVLELGMERFDFVDAFLAFWPLKKVSNKNQIPE